MAGLPYPIRAVRAIIFILYLITSITVGLSLKLVLWLLIRPVSENAWIRTVCFYQSWYLSHFAFMSEFMVGVKTRFTGTSPPPEASIWMMNHLNHDWIFPYLLCYINGTLGGLRVIIKKSIILVPIFGWAMWFFYWPFVSRNLKKDIPIMNKCFKCFTRAKVPLQMLIFPEGTRITKSKLAESQAYAREIGKPEFKNVLMPKYRGFMVMREGLGTTCKMINDCTIAYTGWPDEIPSFWQLITTDGWARTHTLHVHIDRIPLAAVPETEEGTKQWLYDRWAVKETNMQQLKDTGKFPGPVLSELKIEGGTLIRSLIVWNFYWIGILLAYRSLYHRLF